VKRNNGRSKKENNKDKRNGVDLTYQDVHDLLQRLGRYSSKLDGLSFPGIFPFDFLIFFFLGYKEGTEEERKRSPGKQRQSGTYGKLGKDCAILLHRGWGEAVQAAGTAVAGPECSLR
jgi:hypothetical protein